MPKALLGLADLAAMLCALLCARWTYEWMHSGSALLADQKYVAVSVLALPLWPLLFAHHRLYNSRFVTRRGEEFRRIVAAVTVGVVGLTVVSFFLNIYVARSWLGLVFLFGVTMVTCEREIARRYFNRMRRQGRMLRRVVIVGTNLEGLELARMLDQDRSLGYQVVAFVDDDPSAPLSVRGIPTLGNTADTTQVVKATGASGVVIAATAMDLGSSNRLIRELTDSGIHVELSSTLRDIASHRLTVRPLGRFPVVYVEPVQRHGWRSGAKRTFDLVFASIGMLIGLPILGMAAIAIKLTSPGPVFFRQERVGRDGKRFNVLKLRTMVDGAHEMREQLTELNEADGPLFKMRRDPRVTKVGGALRRTSIDELPQLWNVLHGEMSLVGPRPALPCEVEEWGGDLHQRLRVKPGITGMWQVNGRSRTSFEDYERLDLYYVDNWSLVSDLSILVKTIPTVLFSRGAY